MSMYFILDLFQFIPEDDNRLLSKARNSESSVSLEIYLVVAVLFISNSSKEPPKDDLRTDVSTLIYNSITLPFE